MNVNTNSTYLHVFNPSSTLRQEVHYVFITQYIVWKFTEENKKLILKTCSSYTLGIEIKRTCLALLAILNTCRLGILQDV